MFIRLSLFKEHYKVIVIDLGKQQDLDTDPRVIQQFNFTANIDCAGNTKMCFIIEESKETNWLFTRNCDSIVSSFKIIIKYDRQY